MAELLTSSVHKRLSDNAIVASLCSSYQDNPAVFTSFQVPGNAGARYVMTVASQSSNFFSTDTLSGNRITRKISVVDDPTGSGLAAELIATEIQNLFTWTSLSIDGFQNWLATTGPHWVTEENDDVLVYSLLVTFFQSTVSSGTVGFQDYEIPVEVPDNSITNFSTTRTFSSGSVMVWVNGYPQEPGVDFAENSNGLGYTFSSGAPFTGDKIWHSYRYST